MRCLTLHCSLITCKVAKRRAVSSVVEHLVYTERVGGSKPSPPRFSIAFEENSADSGNTFQVVVLLQFKSDVHLTRRRWPRRWRWTRPRRGRTDLENGSLVVSAAFCRHAIEPIVNKNHVIDRFSAIVIICLPTKAIKAVVIVTTGINHKDSAQILVAAVGSRAIE